MSNSTTSARGFTSSSASFSSAASSSVLSSSAPPPSSSSPPQSSSSFAQSSSPPPSSSSFQQFSSSAAPASSFAASSSAQAAAPASSAAPVATTALITSVITESPASNGATAVATTVILTSTAAGPVFPAATSAATPTTSRTSSSTSSDAAALATSSAAPQTNSGGLSAGGKIAVAVVVPVAAVALIVFALLFLWRRRKQRKDAEELRRKEVEEYGFNPNNDPTLPAVVGTNSFGDEPTEMREDGAGYRGWGTTTTARKPSTQLSGGAGPIGMALSDGGSNPGDYNHNGSPTGGTGHNSDVHSGDPLVGSPNGRPLSTGSETIGALGAAPVIAGNRQDKDIHRGPSNASSAYSGGRHSDTSGEAPMPGAAPGPQHYKDGVYYDEHLPQHGPFGDGTYGGMAQPVIRDVQARRNTRIENPKFGKHLQKRQLDIPEYAASFVNYKALKKLIKQLSATPTLLAQNAADAPTEVLDAQVSLQANKATFFFRLERELEKVNACYLQKEAELKLRLKTLIDKKKVMQSRGATTSKISASFITLEEGFQQFNNDLNKLQQFVEVNATAFSKILKKWDKTSKSRTKELYLSRAVDVQPCFNRDVISDLSDQATTNLLDLGAWAEGENIQYDSSRSAEHTVTGQSVGTDENDADSQILQAANAGNIPNLKEWINRLRESSDARDRFTRTFLAAVTDAPEEALDVLLETELVDIHAKDEINERNCLHEAAISGRDFVLRTGLSKGVNCARVDVYGRIPLHYACMYGHVEMVRKLLEMEAATVDSLDHDNFTPLIHGIVHHQFASVQELLHHRARIDPLGESDHVPLNLACQHGSLPIAELLLQEKAKILPDAEGLYPQHLVARSGQTPQLLLMLASYGADLDQKDKLYQWTPLFHAAGEGCVQCLNTLLKRGVDVSVLDEKGLSAMYYATWEGHLECMKLLGSVGGNSGLERSLIAAQCGASTTPTGSAPEPMRMDADGIPDLSLPPPIIPLRRYGHNFLDDKTFVQISFEEAGSDAIIFYHDSKYPAARLTISSKLSDLIPRNVMLPIQEDFKIISFQIDNLESFAIDFDIFPTFGSKVIAKSVALPNIFSAITSSSGHCCLPLFDPRLRAIGQISFNFQVIKPFHGIPLEITHFATYWKATSQFDSHPNDLITGSSLSGEYARLFVQLTSDGMPVLYPQWSINHHCIEFPIGRLTYEQFVALGLQRGNGDEVLASLPDKTWDDKARIHELLSNALVSLRAVLACLPTSINLDFNVMYPTAVEERALGLGPTLNINNFADAILKEVFDHARISREKNPDFMRSIVFTSYNPDICVALNWKQPNYPVLLCNDLGSGRATQVSTQSGIMQSSGRRSMSVKEAVRIAQSNNFMGLICSSRLLTTVPALIESIKVAGLVLVTDTSDTPTSTISTNTAPPHPHHHHHTQYTQSSSPTPSSYRMPDGVDGVLKGNGVLRFNESIDM